jgi:hypothetical protein
MIKRPVFQGRIKELAKFKALMTKYYQERKLRNEFIDLNFCN